MNPSETPHGSIALNFVRALVSGNTIKARKLLSDSVRDDIQKELDEMIEYGDGPVDHIEVMNEMTTWPCLLYTSPSPRDRTRYRMPSSA